MYCWLYSTTELGCNVVLGWAVLLYRAELHCCIAPGCIVVMSWAVLFTGLYCLIGLAYTIELSRAELLY